MKEMSVRNKLVQYENWLAKVQQQLENMTKELESSTDPLSREATVCLRSVIQRSRMSKGIIRSTREEMHGLITIILIEEEYNGRKRKTNPTGDIDPRYECYGPVDLEEDRENEIKNDMERC
jgi:hypothetical protein